MTILTRGGESICDMIRIGGHGEVVHVARRAASSDAGMCEHRTLPGSRVMASFAHGRKSIRDMIRIGGHGEIVHVA